MQSLPFSDPTSPLSCINAGRAHRQLWPFSGRESATEVGTPFEEAPAVDPELEATYQRIEKLEAAAASGKLNYKEQLPPGKSNDQNLLLPKRLQQQKLDTELAELSAQQQRRLESTEQLAAAKQAAQAELRMQIEQQGLQQQLLQSELAADNTNCKLRKSLLKLSVFFMRATTSNEMPSSMRCPTQIKRIQTELERDFSSQEKQDNYATQPIDYAANILTEEGFLRISDRRIALNGPIIYDTADYIEQRINFYANLDDKTPIFLVIDNCPGGSVMEGDRIFAIDGFWQRFPFMSL